MRHTAKTTPDSTASTGPENPDASTPVVPWALLGAANVGLIGTCLVRWFASDDLRAAPAGVDSFGGWRAIFIQAAQLMLVAGALWLVWRSLVRPLVRERRLTFDGMLVIGGSFAGFWEPTGSFLNVALVYNANLWNLGSWAGFIPGWRTPNAVDLATPPLFVWSMYLLFVAAFPMLGCAIIKAVRANRPRWSSTRLITIVYLWAFATDFIFEFIILRTEIYAYPATPSGMTLWSGQPYQFPVMSAIGGAIVVTGLTAFRYGRSADGRSFVERGVSELRVPSWVKQALASLAVVAFTNLWVVLGWFVPMNLFVAMQPGTAPTLPSYLRTTVCGEGTNYACPSRYVPVPGPESAHIAPDGRMISPGGNR